MPSDEDILAYHLAHPLLSPNHIARRLGIGIPRASRVIGRHLQKARPKNYEPTPEEIAAFMEANRQAKLEERESSEGPGFIHRPSGCREIATFFVNGKVLLQARG